MKPLLIQKEIFTFLQVYETILLFPFATTLWGRFSWETMMNLQSVRLIFLIPRSNQASQKSAPSSVHPLPAYNSSCTKIRNQLDHTTFNNLQIIKIIRWLYEVLMYHWEVHLKSGDKVSHLSHQNYLPSNYLILRQKHHSATTSFFFATWNRFSGQKLSSRSPRHLT